MMTRGGNREQEISTISRQLKALSKELGIPVLAMKAHISADLAPDDVFTYHDK